MPLRPQTAILLLPTNKINLTIFNSLLLYLNLTFLSFFLSVASGSTAAMKPRVLPETAEAYE